MYGIYPAEQEDTPGYFRPFEYYERWIRRHFTKLHIHRQPREYSISPAHQDGQTQVFVGRPAINAPSPYNKKGTITLKFEDDLGNRSPGVLSVYFEGTASSKIAPKITGHATLQGGTVPVISPDIEVSVEAFEFTRTAIIKPVREDPKVSVRLLAGDDLAAYLSDYLLSLLSVEEYAYAAGEPLSIYGDDIDQIVSRSIDELSAKPDYLELDGSYEDIDLGAEDTLELTISGKLDRSSAITFALEARTESGSVVSDIVELRSDDEGRIFEV